MPIFGDFRWQSIIFISSLLASALWLPNAAFAQSKTEKPQLIDFWQPGDRGQRMRIRGRVTSLDGSPVPDVRIFFRHADAEGIDFSYHAGVVTANDKGVYQFGSVIPGNSHRLSHVHVYVNDDNYQYLETEFYFKDDPKADEGDPNAIFLESGTVDGETMMFGRFDIMLIPR